jgi:creatinine amidohydrolase
LKKSATGRVLEEMTWPEVAERFQAGTVVVIPVGAAAKEHGHHLPLNTEYLIVQELTGRLSGSLPIITAPIVGFTYSPVFRKYPGSQHLSSEGFMRLMKDLLINLVDQGARRIAIVNCGDSTEGPLRLVINQVFDETSVRVGLSNLRLLGRRLDGILEQDQGGHADERVTSMMLAIAPESVRMERTRPDYGRREHVPTGAFTQAVRFSGDEFAEDIDYSATGIIGDPTLATAKKGKRILDEITDQLTEGLRVLFPDIDEV